MPTATISRTAIQKKKKIMPLLAITLTFSFVTHESLNGESHETTSSIAVLTSPLPHIHPMLAVRVSDVGSIAFSGALRMEITKAACRRPDTCWVFSYSGMAHGTTTWTIMGPPSLGSMPRWTRLGGIVIRHVSGRMISNRRSAWRMTTSRWSSSSSRKFALTNSGMIMPRRYGSPFSVV